MAGYVLHLSTEENITLSSATVKRLIAGGSGDAALLYLYISCGNDPDRAGEDLNLGASRLSCAAASLRQLGLWPEERTVRIAPGERPDYTERDVLTTMDSDASFRGLYGEIQRLLGRNLNTEELKILLGFVRYLNMPVEVIQMLVCYCKDRARRRGSNRNPSLRAIEKEAYAWAERGIDSIEEASAFIQAQNVRSSRLAQLMEVLQIRGRNLTAAEERYAQSWLEMGFENEAISMAYERTCLNTGGLNWAYMNKILQRWHEAGLHTAQAVRSGDKKPANRSSNPNALDEDVAATIKQMLQEE